MAAERADGVVATILEAASSGTRGNGIGCVSPVEQVRRVRSRSPVPPAESGSQPAGSDRAPLSSGFETSSAPPHLDSCAA